MTVSSAVGRESQTWNEMTHLLECAERRQDDQADAAKSNVTTDRSPDKHGRGAGDDHTRNVTIIEPEDDMTADDESKLTRK